MNALDIARAACMEVGLDPELVRPSFSGTLAFHCGFDSPLLLAYGKAGALGAMAEFGATHLVRCDACLNDRSYPPACTPVRDALRGLTCGRWS